MWFVTHGITVLLLISVGIQANIIATRCRDGIVIASDHAPFVVKKHGASIRQIPNCRSIFAVNDETVIAIVEGSSKFHHLYQDLQRFVRQYRYDNGLEEETSGTAEVDVSVIAKVARKLIANSYPREHVVIAGYSNQLNSYCLYEIVQQGSLFPCDFVVGGSGDQIAANLVSELYAEPVEQYIDGEIPNPFEKRWLSPKGRSLVDVPRKSHSLPVTIHSALPIVKKAMRIASSMNQRTSTGKTDLWILETQPKETD